eukprot:GILI01021716.1.p1 GENE.GILI01021716.1~~GILI01021716.1.p1  ORF type:complete len:381 (-),score=56.07 GILI01021716.1:69-1211(-)
MQDLSTLTANKGLANFHKAAMDPTGSFVAVCAPGGQTRLRIYKVSHPGQASHTDADRGAASDELTNPPPTMVQPTQSQDITFDYLCETSEPTASVVDVCWSHPSAGLLVAISCTDRCINVYKLKRLLDGTPALERTGAASRAFTILAKEIVLAVAFPPVRRSNTLLAMAMNNGDLAIHSITANEKREAYVQLDAELPKPQQAQASVAVVRANPQLAPDAAKVDNRPAATAVAWCPSAAETSNVLVVGFANGSCQIVKVFDSMYVSLLRFEPAAQIGKAISCVAWAPPLGKEFQTVASCSTGALVITEFTTTIAENKRDGGCTIVAATIRGEVLKGMLGAVKVSWSKTGDQLAVTCAGNHTNILTRGSLGNSLSWKVTTEL